MTTTAAHAGFIADICEHPEDDSIRLIYADWLEDHGDPERAEFIRVQCLEEIDYRTDYNSAAGSNRKGCRILRRFGHEWLGTLYEAGWGRDCVWSRGFLAEVHAPLAVLEKHLPALVRQHPIERVRVTDKEPRHYNGLTESYVWWRHLVESHPQSRLPQNVWNAVREDGNPPGTYLDNGKRFLAADAAHAALSEAMLRLAKGVNFALES